MKKILCVGVAIFANLLIVRSWCSTNPTHAVTFRAIQFDNTEYGLPFWENRYTIQYRTAWFPFWFYVREVWTIYDSPPKWEPLEYTSFDEAKADAEKFAQPGGIEKWMDEQEQRYQDAKVAYEREYTRGFVVSRSAEVALEK